MTDNPKTYRWHCTSCGTQQQFTIDARAASDAALVAFAEEVEATIGYPISPDTYLGKAADEAKRRIEEPWREALEKARPNIKDSWNFDLLNEVDALLAGESHD